MEVFTPVKRNDPVWSREECNIFMSVLYYFYSEQELSFSRSSLFSYLILMPKWDRHSNEVDARMIPFQHLMEHFRDNFKEIEIICIEQSLTDAHMRLANLQKKAITIEKDSAEADALQKEIDLEPRHIELLTKMLERRRIKLIV